MLTRRAYVKEIISEASLDDLGGAVLDSICPAAVTELRNVHDRGVIGLIRRLRLYISTNGARDGDMEVRP